MKTHNWKNIKKLALGVMAFEGSEHLENIISELRDLIDVVIIGYQKESYHGDRIDASDMKTLQYLQDIGLSDHLIHIHLDLNKDARVQETDKRNAIIEFAENQGCSHIIIIDADEFYTHNSFYNALKEIDDNDYEMTYCQYVNYYHDYLLYLVYPFADGMHVPFVSKVKYRHSFETTDFPLPSDPTRRYVIPKDSNGNFTATYHIFPWNKVKMHHLSWLRVNIRKKLKSWSSKKCFNDQELLIDKAVYDFEHFDEILKKQKDNQKVHLVFNTPGNTVNIEEFPKQYIFPKKDFYKTYKYSEDPKNILVLNMSSTAGNGLFIELENTCRETWVKQIEKYDMRNVKYFSIIDGPEDYIDFHNKIIYVRDTEDLSNFDNFLYRFIHGLHLLKKAGYAFDYDYIVRTNTSTWLNLPLINKIIANETDESIIYGYSLQAAFWSQYGVYPSGELLIMSKRQADVISDEMNKRKLNGIKSVGDDVLIGSIFSTRCSKMEIPQYYYFKDLYCNDNSGVAIQIKDLNNNHDFDERKKINIEKMKQVNRDQKINIDKQYKNYLELIKSIKINIIPYTKHEWLTELNDNQKLPIIRKSFIKTFDNYKELSDYQMELKKKGGYA